MIKLRNMVYKRFEIITILKAVLIAIVSFLFVFSLDKENLVFTRIFLFITWIGLLISLILYVNKTNKNLSRFFLAFKYKDSTMVFTENEKSKSFNQLNKSFNHIIKAFSEVKIQKESDYIFYNKLINYVSVGLLAFKENGEIVILNKSFSDLFGIPQVADIESIHRINPELYSRLKETDNNSTFKTIINNEIKHISIKPDKILIENNNIYIFSFQDIKAQLEEKEMESWQKLIRVYTHEITNSISPISLISRGVISNLSESGSEYIDEAIEGLNTINKRSRGLLKFVEEYKKLTDVKSPSFSKVNVSEIFSHLKLLFKDEFDKKNIKFSFECDDIHVNADSDMLSIVLINLIKNAIYATVNTESPVINIGAEHLNNTTIIKVTDNGKGITADELDNIFVPFYTTRKDGSGIGLSLSQQIVHKHNGHLNVSSVPGKTCFTINI